MLLGFVETLDLDFEFRQPGRSDENCDYLNICWFLEDIAKLVTDKTSERPIIGSCQDKEHEKVFVFLSC